MTPVPRHEALAACRALWVTDRLRLREPLVEHAERLLAAGLHGLILRERDLGDPAVEDMARRLAITSRTSGALVLLTNRAHLVPHTGAAGVHLGRGGPTAREARRLAGPEALVGLSLHGERELESEDARDADYLVVSPVFPTESKPGVAPLGLERLAALCRIADRPVFALGGVGPGNAAECLAAGAHGVALVGGLSGSDPEAEWCDLARALAGTSPGAAAGAPGRLC